MKEYLNALEYCYKNGIDIESRAGKVRKIFGNQMRFDLSKSFPILTTKKMAWRSIVSELIWFLEGSGDERRLAEIHYEKDRNLIADKNTIWTQNANAEYWKSKSKYIGDLGKIYGVQWRNFNGVDQIAKLIEGIKEDPNGRRHIINAWNVAELDQMALPPCHVLVQFYIENNKLSSQLYQRSCDMFLGVPFNISSYSLLTYIIAKECNLQMGEFIHTLGDYHIYHRHFDQVEEQLLRKTKILPKLNFEKKNIFNYKVNDFNLSNYEFHPAIKAKMNV
tara:strand:- start:82 stop:912 length:831 start_codon:yes stop_codon:yes gene_type:complete